MADIQKADPAAVRIAVALLVGGTLLGVMLITLADGYRSDIEAWVKQDVSRRVPMVLAAVTLLTVGPVLGIAGYLWRFSRRMIHSKRYPPEGFRMVRDTPVVTGDAAVRQGRIVSALAVGLGSAGLVLAFLLWRLFLLL